MDHHSDTCHLDPAHYACAIARAAHAEGALDEARRVAAEALAQVHHQVDAEQTLRRVSALRAEFQRDLERKGGDWHPRARAIAEQVITQLGTALGVGEA
ncbi:hypothetical protein [Nocardiopsis sp. CNR-923]|uniref:hypothetical protein n=1 Tax=Nocardiopsis sp. CNR-923 TaxID=1904965 RepID=UPI001180DE3B|nr:hypothetical protein [Nocardiopsis sp. CNR-923]